VKKCYTSNRLHGISFQMTTIFKVTIVRASNLTKIKLTYYKNIKESLSHTIISIIQVALKALQASKTTSPLVQQCQKALNDISTGTLWGCIGSLDMLGYKEMKSLTSSQETVPFKSLLDLSCPWVSLGRI